MNWRTRRLDLALSSMLRNTTCCHVPKVRLALTKGIVMEGPMRSEMDLAEQTKNEPFSLKMEDLCKGVIEQVRQTYAAAKLSDVLAA